jgi:anthranilate phosphoribosyltransferase
MKKQPVVLYSTASESVALFRRFLEKQSPRITAASFLAAFRARRARRSA